MSTHTAMIFLISTTTTLLLAAEAGPAAAPPSVDCTTLVLNLADCLSFVSAGSEVEKPEGTCCPGLKSVLKSHAECLCEAFKNSAQFGVTLNVSKALSLPAACHVSAPSVSNCGLSLVTGGAPASAPVGAMSPSIPAGSPTSALGSIEAPAPASSASGLLAFSTWFFVISTMVVLSSF